MEIVPYAKEYRDAFVELNEAWLEKLYTVEGHDRWQMDHVGDIVHEGGMAYFAVEDDEVLATCMTFPLKEGVWEICKLAARNQGTSKGAGTAVFEACMSYAVEYGAERLVLISCRALEAAIHIYRKHGFVEVPLDEDLWGKTKADIQMEWSLGIGKPTALE